MNDTVKLAVRLMIFALVAALLLACVNELTKDRIDENTRSKINAARMSVIGEYEFTDAECDLTGCDYIKAVNRAVDGGRVIGYVFDLESKGYGGIIYISLGMSSDGRITGVKVSSHSETKGLGTEAADEFFGEFLNIGAGDDAMEIDAMSGATVSSTAIRKAVNEALEFYSANLSGDE